MILMKKIILLSIFVILTTFSYSATLTVCSSGCGYTTIQAAMNAASDGDIILLNVTGTFTEKNITIPEKNLTIQGLGRTTTILQSASTRASASGGRIFTYNNPSGAGGNTFTVKDMTIQYAIAPLTDLGGGQSQSIGGVLYVPGGTPGPKGFIVTFDNVKLYANETTGGNANNSGGACVYVSATGSTTPYNAQLTFTNCIFDDNKVANSAGSSLSDGPGFNLLANGLGGKLTIDNCTITNNSGYTRGGFIYCGSTWNITVKNSNISNNTCRNGDGGVFNGRSGTWTIENCTFKSNSAVFVSTVNGNNGNGGVFLGKGASFKNCTFYNNSAVKGGAICRTSNGTDATSIVNCTFYGNSASSTGKTIQIGTSSSTNYNLDLVNTIITNGGGAASSEIHFVVPYSQFRTNLKNYCTSISTENGTPGTTPTFDFTSGNTTSAIATTPADNGSGLETMALSSNSTLINSGTNTSTANYEIPIKDQRNYSRTDAGVDVGSYDYNGVVDDAVAPSITYTDLANTNATTDRTLSATITDANGVYNFAQTSDLRPKIYFKKNSGSWNSSVGSLSSGTGRSGSWNFTISASTMGGLTNGDIVSYYVIAQDVSSSSNIISKPTGVSATNVNIVSSPPSTPSSYTIGASSPSISTTGTLSAFSSCSGIVSTAQSFTVSGTNLTNDIVVTPPSGYEVSTSSGSSYAATVTLTQASGTVSSTTIYVRLTSSASGTPSGNIVCSSTGATSQNVAASGTVNALPTITLGSNPSVTNGTTTASLTYSATTSSPNQYSVVWSAGAIIGGFSNVSLTSLPTSPISLTLPSNPGAGSYTGTLTVKNTTTGCSSAGGTMGVTVTVASIPGVTEYFDAFTLGNKSFTNVSTGHAFTLTNNLRIGSTGGNDGVNSNTPAIATVGNGSSKYIDNVPGTGVNTTNSIKTTNGAQFTMKALYIYPSSYALGDYPTTSGTVTFKGKLAGNVVYTITKNNFTPTDASSNYQGFTYIDFASGIDNSNTSIDELEITLGGAFIYFALDNFQFAASPLTTTNAATSVASTTATLNGTINPINYAVSAISFDYSTSSTLASGVTNVVATPSTLVSSSSNGTALANLTGLTAGTTYYYRVKAVNSNGTNAGASILSFTTTAVVPTVTTNTASSVASTTASSGGNVTSSGGASVTARGVCWSTTANPTTANSKTTDGTGTGTFTSSITGLTAGTTYHYRAYATNSAGTSYGSDLTFTTTSSCPSTPLDQNFSSYTNTSYPSSLTVDCITYSTSDVSGNVGVDNALTAGISDGPVFSGNAMIIAFTSAPSPTYAKFASTSNTINFKLASLDAEFYGHANGNVSESYNIIGYDDGVAVVTVNGFNVTASGNYGSGTATISYARSNFNTSHNNTGTLTFGTGWGNIDEVRFVIADNSPYNNLNVGLDNINFEPAVVSSTPTISATGTLSAFSTCSGTVSTAQSFTVSGTNLTNDIVVTPPSGYEVSTTLGSGYTSSVTLTQASGTVSSTTIYARLTSSASGSPTGNIICSSTGATSQNVSASGTVNALPTITLGSNPSVTNGTTAASLTYSATTGGPNQYSVVWSAGAIIGGFSNVSLTSLPTSPISLTVPSNPGAGSYTGTLTVKNTTTGCSSAGSTMGVTVSTPGISISSISKGTPSGTTTNASSVTYTVTFGSSVTGVTASNFSLTASGVTGISITSVSGSGTTYSVVVNTGTGSGSIVLNLSDATGLSSAISTSLPFAGESYTIDKTLPTVTTQNISVYLNAAGTASTTASAVNNGSTDASGIASLSLSQSSFTCANLGANTITLTVTDNAGNIGTGTATITVLDTIKPLVNTQNRTVYLNAAGTATVSALQVNNGSSDACGVASLSLSQTSFTCANVGTPVTVTLTATDVNSNSKTGTATITVLDTIKPVVNTQNRTVYLNAAGTATVSALQVNNGSSDVCGVASLSLSQTSFTCANVGIPVTVTLTATDVNSNSKTGTATITVLDTIKPVVNTQNRTVYLNAAGTATVSALQVNNGSSDACGVASLSLSQTSFTCANVGTPVTVTLTATDVNGNSKTGTATITVLDTIKPVVNTQNVSLLLNVGETVTVLASDINNGSSDVCGIASMSLSKTTFNLTNVGVNNVTLTVTDNNGNIKSGTATVTIAPRNIPPTASNGSINGGQNVDYVFGVSSFNYADVDNDVMRKIQVTSLPVSGTLFKDANTNGLVDGGESISVNDSVLKTDIDAGYLKFKPVSNALGTPYTTFGFKVHDGSVYSTSAYTLTINVLYPTTTGNGGWTNGGSWNTTVTPITSQNARVIGNHTITINSNTTIHDLKLDTGGTIQVTGTSILTIEGDLYDGLGNFSIAPGAKVILKGNIRNIQGTIKVLNSSTNGMQIKGNVHVPQGSDG
jgi:hypothetical protein